MIGWAQCVLAVLLVSIAAGSAPAQSSEISGLVGLTTAVGLDQQAPELTEASVRGGFTWGVQGTRFFTPRWGAEVLFTQQASALEVATAAGSATLYDITLAQLQANVVYQFGANGARLRPFVFGGAGATFFAAHDLDSETKASFGFGGGIKYFPWATVGLRGQLRFKPTWLNDDPENGVCDPFGFCQSWLMPIEVAGGVVIRF